ncbi:MAG TPA: DUF1284 domain-containing protein [Candidatus Merdivicinus intestinigallinarum]|mgnify:CR=1 FL=1|nr:DUF1284 domain-containing protein [Candidatus Merdivicinus intestinigallinarum]
MVKEQMELRAHHGMCLTFFEGKGYSREFAEHMQAIYDGMKRNPMLHITAKEDVICQKCPNLQNGVCEMRELVRNYDRKVLDLCGFRENSEISWEDFSALVKEKIIGAGKRKSICGDCQWTEICGSKEKNAI